jgi:predicted nucleic acid-binding protein
LGIEDSKRKKSEELESYLIFFDTSVIIAGLIEAHPQFEKSNVWLGKVISGKEIGGVSSHTLAELYSALTTIPVVPRLQSDQALYLIEESVLKHFNVYEFKKEDYLAVLKSCSLYSIKGGMIYDALHVHAAKKMKTKILLTLNLKHFLSIWPDGKKIIKNPR